MYTNCTVQALNYLTLQLSYESPFKEVLYPILVVFCCKSRETVQQAKMHSKCCLPRFVTNTLKYSSFDILKRYFNIEVDI